MKLSQAELSHLSGVSVPMIQLIESERGNPSIKTLTAILDVLHMKLECKADEFNWDRFVHHTGLLYEQSVGFQKSLLSTKSLINTLIDASENLSKDFDPRKKETLESTLLALRIYYPTLFNEIVNKYSLLKKLSEFKITGRHIKFKRIVLERLKDYL